MLLEYVLRCLYRVCLHDNENFFNKERFETLMEPLVDQLENQLGEDDAVQRRPSIPFAMPFLSELLKDDVVNVAATAHITLAVFPRFWRIGV
ncbi:hypothetical protein DAPPUDRAFT_235733 [Daphnia pulex]|uniref:HEAT repeat-containing protein 1 n=1 Tax=Daphnia pulex TaxID=6669 RepID=E9G0P3_DAPPU|nr:hypothetical protein DAPPUDRAFT_235733 [Daphnia pulex]|eukprot:EFX86940.1 hypothetical protein DAPPUDRAFT_235733 [Daphnia pulex]